MYSQTILNIFNMLDVKTIDLNSYNVNYDKTLIIEFNEHTNYEIEYKAVDTKTYLPSVDMISEIIYEYDKEYDMLYFKLVPVEEPEVPDIDIFAISKEDLIKNGIEVI